MILHFDYSLPVFLEHIQSALLESSQEVIILRDLYGRLSCHLLDESEKMADQIEEKLKADEGRLGMYYSYPLVLTHKEDDRLWQRMQSLAQPLPSSLAKEPRVKLIERLLEGKSWLSPTQSPFETSPPYIITFYSFKGGVGRTTAAAMSALKIARQGHRVCMIDLDLEAPGFSSITSSSPSPQSKGGIGVIDYLLERTLTKDKKLRLDDYLVRNKDKITQEQGGELWLMPAGTVNKNYLVKLGRLDFQKMSAEDFSRSALKQLFLDLQQHRAFDYYVVDSRTGITDIGGLALNGLAHLNVMLFGIGAQNIRGMHFVLEHLRPMLEKQLANARKSKLIFVFSPVPLGGSEQTDREMASKLTEITENAIRKHLSHLPKDLIPIDPIIIPYLPRLPIQEDLSGVDYVQRQDANPPPYDQLAESILKLTQPSDKAAEEEQSGQITDVRTNIQKIPLAPVGKKKSLLQQMEIESILSSPRRLVLSTIGISLLTAHLRAEERGTLREFINAQTLKAEDEAIIEEIVLRAEETLASDDLSLIRRKSAELNGIYAIYENQIAKSKQDIHILVTTDTVLGRRTAELIRSHLQRHGIMSLIYVPRGLTQKNQTQFDAGIKELIHWCAETIPDYANQGYITIFNLVAGFNALQGYLNVIGMLLADHIFYLLQGEQTSPILLPRLPIKIDIESLKQFAVELAMMAEGNAVLSITQLRGLPRTLYDYDETQNVMISQWGLLVWQELRNELLSSELLAFPRLRYEYSFLRDFNRTRDLTTRVRLQSVLAKIATILVESNGDPSPLKSLGGVHFDNYAGKRLNNQPISHFRVSNGLRVSCMAEDGKLILRHFGEHDYVNANP